MGPGCTHLESVVGRRFREEAMEKGMLILKKTAFEGVEDLVRIQ